MSAVLRTVRRLDGKSEVVTVDGFVIETGIPIPKRVTKTSAIHNALAALQPGQSIVHANRATEARKRLRRAASLTFAARPIAGGKWRIWRK